MTLPALVAVFLGSGVGGCLRYMIGLATRALLGTRVAAPWAALAGTAAVNFVGSLLLVLALTRFDRSSVDAATLRLALTTGLLGGFTTYSTFNAESFSLLQGGRYAEATGYLAGTVALCLLGGWLGYRLGS